MWALGREGGGGPLGWPRNIGASIINIVALPILVVEDPLRFS